METFTCMTCRMYFDNADVQRNHYRTPWHCFNLKRKVAGLTPVTEEAFDEKVKALRIEKSVLDSQQQQQSVRQRPTSKKQHKFQKGRGRNAANNLSEVARELGVSLDEPQDSVAAADQIADESEPEMTEEEMIEERLRTAKPIPTNECLFDGHVSNDLASNLDYTRRTYGFFIPEIENLVDLDGLMSYLGEKVGVGYTCLYCGKGYQSLQAVRSHMVDKSHCKIKFYEELEEYDDFYNFDEEESDVENKNRALITVHDDGTVDTGITLSETGSELVLHNGKTIGNRAYKIYYKQRAKPSESRTSVLMVQLVKQYNDLGYLKEKRADEIIARKKQEKRIRQNSYEHVKIQLKANRLQKHMHHKECMT